MVAQLFNTNHGLKFDTEKKRMSMVDISALNIDDAGDSRCVFFHMRHHCACIVVQYVQG
jgi:hypothetical protein